MKEYENIKLTFTALESISLTCHVFLLFEAVTEQNIDGAKMEILGLDFTFYFICNQNSNFILVHKTYHFPSNSHSVCACRTMRNVSKLIEIGFSTFIALSSAEAHPKKFLILIYSNLFSTSLMDRNFFGSGDVVNIRVLLNSAASKMNPKRSQTVCR